MKRTILLLAFFAMLGIPAFSQVFTDGFESWTGNVPNNWVGVKTSLEADSISPYTSNVHGGTYACKLVNRESTHKRFTTQPVSITNGDVYTITFWTRGHGNIRTGLFEGGAHYQTYNSYIAVNTTTWTMQTQQIAADSTSATAEFIFSVQSTVADLEDLQIDDINITAGSTPDVSIYDIQYTTTSPYDSPYKGQVVNTGGIVTGMISTGFFLQSGSGLWNGVFVYTNDTLNTLGIARGDSLTFTASVTEYYNNTELQSLANFVKVSSGNAEPAPYAITGANQQDEATESVLLKASNENCTVATNSYGVWTLFDTDSIFVDNLMFYYAASVGIHYNVTGVNYLSYGDYYMEPRDAADVEIYSGINENDQNSVSIYPNPVSDMIYINNVSGTDKVTITNLLGQNVIQNTVNGNNMMINVSKLSKGIYFVSLLNEQGVQTTKKFVKE